MNSKNVLNKIISLLSAAEVTEEVKLAFAELADGTVVESPTFDVGESVEVVAEDGSKSPAPNGEHELMLRDEEGNEVRFKIFVEDGKITERENVELEIEVKEVEKLPETEMSDAEEIKDEADVAVVNLEEVSKKMEEMSYRIEELEKKIAEMQEIDITVDEEDKEEVEMSSVAPLNGAPMASKPLFNTRKTNSAQAAFLAKLYN
jgi:hypothetical protein